MSGKKGGKDGKRKTPKVEINPAFSDDEPEAPNLSADNPKMKKMSDASSDSGAYSQDDPNVRKKDDTDAGLKVELGECSGYQSPEASPSKGKGSKSPIMKIKAGAGKVCKAVAAGLRSISPNKKKGLADSMEEEHERPPPTTTKSPKRKTKVFKRMPTRVSLEKKDSCPDSGVTTISSLPDSDQTSFDEKSDYIEGDKDDSLDDSEE